MDIHILKSKWYYRFLKVVYIVIFVFFLITPATAAFIDNLDIQVFNPNESFIVCDEVDKKFIATDYSIESNYISSSVDKKIKHDCRTAAIASSDNKYFAYGYGGAYTFHPSYYIENNFLIAGGFALLSIICALVSFELIKRIFFYIVTGNFLHIK